MSTLLLYLSLQGAKIASMRTLTSLSATLGLIWDRESMLAVDIAISANGYDTNANTHLHLLTTLGCLS